MKKREMQDKVRLSIEKQRERIIGIGQEIFEHPETGFKEFHTSALVEKCFGAMNLHYQGFTDIPGGKVTLDTGKEGPGIAILGELDSVICREHPSSNRETGAVHACGHNIQVAAMLGAAMGIVQSGVLKDLCGKIHFIAVPAEEYIEVEFRRKLRDEGTIHYLGGKPEFLYRGVFDDVDMCIMLHAFAGGNKKFGLQMTNNGCLVKKIRYLGKASHAGGSPHEGINALYAANVALSAINALRETFPEWECIRVHPIITKGGDIVNVIPADVRMETFVRGKSMESILKANRKVNRALIGGAVALGAKVEIEDIPGYFPLNADERLNDLAREVMKDLVDEKEIETIGHGAGSTDMGDLSTLMPVIQPFIGGTEGLYHGATFRITDPDVAYILGAKFLASTAVELLWGNGEKARDILDRFTPNFSSKEAYFAYADRLFSKEVYPKEDWPDEIQP